MWYFAQWTLVRQHLQQLSYQKNLEKTEKHQENEVNDEEFN
jgi:hypothetical protein